MMEATLPKNDKQRQWAQTKAPPSPNTLLQQGRRPPFTSSGPPFPAEFPLNYLDKTTKIDLDILYSIKNQLASVWQSWGGERTK